MVQPNDHLLFHVSITFIIYAPQLNPAYCVDASSVYAPADKAGISS